MWVIWSNHKNWMWPGEVKISFVCVQFSFYCLMISHMQIMLVKYKPYSFFYNLSHIPSYAQVKMNKQTSKDKPKPLKPLSIALVCTSDRQSVPVCIISQGSHFFGKLTLYFQQPLNYKYLLCHRRDIVRVFMLCLGQLYALLSVTTIVVHLYKGTILSLRTFMVSLSYNYSNLSFPDDLYVLSKQWIFKCPTWQGLQCQIGAWIPIWHWVSAWHRDINIVLGRKFSIVVKNHVDIFCLCCD